METSWLTSVPRVQAVPESCSGVGLIRSKLQGAATHLGISTAVAACVLAVVFLGWYRAPLDTVSGVGEILKILLAVDVVLGPVLTLVVFDRRKTSLRFDLTCIALMQVAGLAYGVYAVEAGRPHHLVFVKDRFEVISRSDLQLEDRKAAAGNGAADAEWLGPKVVAAEMPASANERKELLFESAFGGRDLQHFPKQYRDYATQAPRAAAKGLPLSVLLALNPNGHRILQSAIDRSGLPEDRLKFLPVKGPRADAAMLVDASSGSVKGMVGLMPWQE